MRGTCQGLSDYTCTRLPTASVELVTAAAAGVRGEVKRTLKSYPRGDQYRAGVGRRMYPSRGTPGKKSTSPSNCTLKMIPQSHTFVNQASASSAQSTESTREWLPPNVVTPTLQSCVQF